MGGYREDCQKEGGSKAEYERSISNEKVENVGKKGKRRREGNSKR